MVIKSINTSLKYFLFILFLSYYIIHGNTIDCSIGSYQIGDANLFPPPQSTIDTAVNSFRPSKCIGYKQCDMGYYCIDGLKLRCPPGTYGSSIGLSNAICSGLCSSGWYCPIGSIFPRNIPCATSIQYCPEVQPLLLCCLLLLLWLFLICLSE